MDFWKWVSNERDRALAIVAVVVGAVAIVLGWLGVSRSVIATQQIPYLASGAVGGLFLLGGGATLWLSSDLRDEWRKLDDIQAEIREAVAAQTAALEAQSAAVARFTNGHEGYTEARGGTARPAERQRPLTAASRSGSRRDGSEA
jgi:hypothetical protein